MKRTKLKNTVDTVKEGVDVAQEAMNLVDGFLGRRAARKKQQQQEEQQHQPEKPGLLWWQVLGLNPQAAKEEIDRRSRELAKLYHPDKGGDGEMMKLVNWARDEGLGR